jgi:hypothetical protein
MLCGQFIRIVIMLFVIGILEVGRNVVRKMVFPSMHKINLGAYSCN